MIKKLRSCTYVRNISIRFCTPKFPGHVFCELGSIGFLLICKVCLLYKANEDLTNNAILGRKELRK